MTPEVVSWEEWHKVTELEGWCNLDNVDEALKTFLSLPQHIRDKQEVLRTFTAFLWGRGRFSECVAFAARGTVLYPTVYLFWWICSICFGAAGHREMRKQVLLAGAAACPGEAELLRRMANE